MFLLGLILSGFLDFWTTSSPIETFDNFPEQDSGEIQIYVFSARSTGQVAMDLSTYLPTYILVHLFTLFFYLQLPVANSHPNPQRSPPTPHSSQTSQLSLTPNANYHPTFVSKRYSRGKNIFLIYELVFLNI